MLGHELYTQQLHEAGARILLENKTKDKKQSLWEVGQDLKWSGQDSNPGLLFIVAMGLNGLPQSTRNVILRSAWGCHLEAGPLKGSN